MTGESPDFPMSWPDLEAQASAAMDPGANGVTQVIRNLLSEIDLTLALSGHQSPRTLNPAVLCRRH